MWCFDGADFGVSLNTYNYLKEEIPMKVDRKTVVFILNLLANVAKAVVGVLDEYPNSETG